VDQREKHVGELRARQHHGPRSILYHAKRMKHRDRLRAWALRLERKVGHNKAAAAVANQLARITWAVWKNDRNFEPVFEPQPA
jgi:hypothetical protein